MFLKYTLQGVWTQPASAAKQPDAGSLFHKRLPHPRAALLGGIPLHFSPFQVQEPDTADR